MGEDGLRMAVEAAAAQARFAAWLDGDGIEAAPEPVRGPLERVGQPIATPAVSSAGETPGAPRLGTGELAKLHGMTPRGALKRIMHGYDQGLPGFFCKWRGERRHWFAEPYAFAQFRMSSDGAARGTSSP